MYIDGIVACCQCNNEMLEVAKIVLSYDAIRREQQISLVKNNEKCNMYDVAIWSLEYLHPAYFFQITLDIFDMDQKIYWFILHHDSQYPYTN
jgi:hypothetical protein